MKIVGKAPTEDPGQALREMDFPSGKRYLFIGGPFDGSRRHVEMTTYGPDNIITVQILPDAPSPNFMNALEPSSAEAIEHRYIRIPLYPNGEEPVYVYQHEDDMRNGLVALIEGYAKP